VKKEQDELLLKALDKQSSAPILAVLNTVDSDDKKIEQLVSKIVNETIARIKNTDIGSNIQVGSVESPAVESPAVSTLPYMLEHPTDTRQFSFK
jgi:hypothetical protein